MSNRELNARDIAAALASVERKIDALINPQTVKAAPVDGLAEARAARAEAEAALAAAREVTAEARELGEKLRTLNARMAEILDQLRTERNEK